ncbi:tape measure protein [Xanthomonas phage XAJ2]|uniref:Tape measure protein n=1 Tax=Xanthomonas phage XAJ2 TaxID=1775249 RepID=A0A1I9L2E9_9CAUD|nr:tape measure protein [Xanthomonas phage XAJ2]
MADNIVIKVDDGIASSIDKKLESIEKRANAGASAIARLNNALKTIQPSGLAGLSIAFGTAARQLDLATAAAGRFTAAMGAMTPAQARAAAANNAAALAAQKLATEQQRTAAAAAKAGIAQQQLANALARAQGAQNGAALGAQKLATEQQRTAVQSANAAAASDRAALAALRLQQAQNRAAEASSRAGSALLGYARNAAAALGAGFSAAAILSMSDAYVVLQNKLQNVSTSQAQVNELTGELFELANRTRTGVQETATAFARFDRSLKQMGKSQADTLRLTETVNKALIVGGATASEASSALLQLSQAFNAGRLQGDEFRAVSENMPAVLDAVAKVLNKPINQIKQLGSEGKITAKVMFDAFTLMRSEIDKTFGKTAPTLSQGLTVLKNEAIEFFGELNKAFGITEGLSRAMIALGANLRTVAVAAVAVGGAMLLAFGPQIVAAIGSATGAVTSFTLALARNPIGLFAVALASAIAYLTLFRDEIKLGTDATTTLGDLMESMWASISGGASEAWNAISDFFTSTEDGSATTFEQMTKNADDAGKFQEETWVKLSRTVLQVFDMIGGVARGVARGIQNVFMATISLLITNFKNLGEIASAALQGDFEGVAEAFTRNKNQMSNAGNLVGEAFSQGIQDEVISQADGGLEAWFDQQLKNAKKLGEERTAAAKAARGNLRGTGEDTTGGDTGNTKAAEKRAAALAKVNAQLDNELERMFKLQPAREAQAKFDQIEEQLIGKKIKLNEAERASIMGKINALSEARDVQQQFDRIYAASSGPQKDYTASLSAADKLLKMGAISQAEFNAEVMRAGEVYKNASDPLYAINKELDEQMKLLAMLPRQREVEQQILQATNKALQDGKPLRAEEIDQLRQKLAVTQQINEAAQFQNQLMQNSNAEQNRNFSTKAGAASSLMSNPASGFGRSDAVNSFASDIPALQETTAFYQNQIEQTTQMYAKIKELRALDVIDEQTAQQAIGNIRRQQINEQLAAASGLINDLASLRDSDNKTAARVGKAAAIAQATINTYQAATAAYASGAKINPIFGAVSAAAAVAAGLANVQKIRSTGFMQGGYTGGSSTTQERGVVHGKEFVFDAAATKRIGVNNLESIRNGYGKLSSARYTKNAEPTSNTNTRTTKAASGQVVARSNVQNVSINIQGRPDRRTPAQIAKATAREAAKASSRD